MADGSRTLQLPFAQEGLVDLFAGGGGASLGLARAYRHPDVAVNHNPVAIAVHKANHPSTLHYTCDVYEVDPVEATGGRPLAALWASPDCTHFSRARGSKPRSNKLRALPWVVVRWAEACKPRILIMENVPEIVSWSELLANGKVSAKRKGETFRRWIRALEALGYVVEYRVLVAADFGAPTIRSRLFVIARCDGRPIVWPAPSHHRNGGNGLPKWRAAAECIDFSIPTRSIFDRAKPLAENTLRRICKGLLRYVLNTPDPFIVPPDGAASPSTPFASNEGAPEQLIAAHITKFRHNSIGTSLWEPMHTITAGGQMTRPAGAAHAMGLVAAYFEQANGGFYDGDGRDARSPLSTICGSGANQRLVSAYLVKYYSQGGQLQSCNEPMHTIPSKSRMGLVEAASVRSDLLPPAMMARAKAIAQLVNQYLPEHFPTPVDLILVGDYVLVDLALRMITPRELASCQGFPVDYILDRGADGEPVTKTDQVKLIGNSVCPDVAEAIVKANVSDLNALYERLAA